MEFFEKFQILLYTKPYNVRVDVCSGSFGGKVIQSIELDVPGENVHTLTSAASLIRNVPYEKVQVNEKKKAAIEAKEKAKLSKQSTGLGLESGKKAGTKLSKGGKLVKEEEDEDDDAVTIVNGQKVKKKGKSIIEDDDDDEE